MLADRAKCPSCKNVFDIPESSTNSAGDAEGNYAEWVTKDIHCPECGTVVLNSGKEIYAAGAGPW